MGKRKRDSDQTLPDRPFHFSGAVTFSNQMDVRSEEDQTLARPAFMKRLCHQYSHQYYRRGSTSQPNASTSRENRVRTILEERPAFKFFAAHRNSEFPDHIDGIERSFWGPERIRYNSLGKDAISSNGMRMLCGICQKLMRRKLCSLGNTPSSRELPVAAVLVCGHVYHADCLENRPNVEDRSDPPCPLCTEPPIDDSKGEQE
ncbi:uncharacterized protein LOC111432724 [Cucurbita moschata]|uniref:Uncharacterized protein LOC111432724 n=1 Tax=Cucurbita moschata TaxID=3662 RepID=A0A6J1EHY3_CUCMO|nr:uncharacterized protein LOC111432724 [Cucurbita moschata]